MPAQRKMTDEQLQEAASLRADGRSFADIAPDFAVSDETLRLRMVRAGLEVPRSSGWTEERLAVVMAKYIMEGLSAGETGKLLGVSRNAVIGVAHRQGWARGRSPIHREINNHGAQAKTKAPAPKLTAAPPPAPKLTPAQQALPKVAVIHHDYAVKLSPPVPLPVEHEDGEATVFGAENLERNGCRWPIGDPAADGFGFCGAQRGDRGPYCAEHARRASAGPGKPLKAPWGDYRTVNKREAEEYVLKRAGLS